MIEPLSFDLPMIKSEIAAERATARALERRSYDLTRELRLVEAVEALQQASRHNYAASVLERILAALEHK